MIQKERIIGRGGIIAQTEQVYLRPIRSDDRDSFLWVASHCKYYVPGISREDFDRCFFTADDEDTITLCVIGNETDEFAGFCQLLNIRSEEPELSFEIIGDFRNRDIEYEICNAVIGIVFSRCDQQVLYYRTTRANFYKRSIADRIGADLVCENYARNLYKHLGYKSNISTSTMCEMDVFTYIFKKNGNRKEGKITGISFAPWLGEVTDAIRKKVVEYTTEIAWNMDIEKLSELCYTSRDNLELFKPLYDILYERDIQAAFEVFNRIMRDEK